MSRDTIILIVNTLPDSEVGKRWANNSVNYYVLMYNETWVNSPAER